MRPWKNHPKLGRAVRFGLTFFGCRFVCCYANPQGRKANWPVIFNAVERPRVDLQPGSEPRLFVVGRLQRSKRVDIILNAASQASWRRPIVVVGAGEAEDELREQASALNLDVSFKGFTPDPWVLSSSNDIFVTASEFEGEPLAMVEGIQRNLPVLASEIDSHVRLLENHPGIFRTEEELVEMLHEFAAPHGGQDLFRINSARRSEILQERSPDVIAAKWIGLYKDVIVNG